MEIVILNISEEPWEFQVTSQVPKRIPRVDYFQSVISYWLLTFAHDGLSVESISSATARRADTRVGPNSIIAALRSNAVVQIKQAFVNICIRA